MKVVEHDGTLWVAGFDEMIATSSDGGATWSVRNRKNHGEILTSFVFFDAQRLAVFGTAGIWYESRDGGQRWQRWQYQPDYSLSKMVFPDDHHGYAIGGTEIASTNDGGNNWNVIRIKLKKSRSTPRLAYARPKQLIAWDALHALVLADTSSSDTQRLISTTDGGKHWREFPLSSGVSWSSLQVQGDGFRMYTR